MQCQSNIPRPPSLLRESAIIFTDHCEIRTILQGEEFKWQLPDSLRFTCVWPLCLTKGLMERERSQSPLARGRVKYSILHFRRRRTLSISLGLSLCLAFQRIQIWREMKEKHVTAGTNSNTWNNEGKQKECRSDSALFGCTEYAKEIELEPWSAKSRLPAKLENGGAKRVQCLSRLATLPLYPKRDNWKTRDCEFPTSHPTSICEVSRGR